MTGAHIGIDLGTTYSLVAVASGGVARVLPNAVGDFLTPTAVCVADDGLVLIGSAARARAGTHPERTALAFKREMGTDRRFQLGHCSFTPEELSALVLGELKRDAESALGRSIQEAVVTVPAYFSELQRRATRDACELAGLYVEHIIDEPTAVALAYGLDHGHRQVRAVVLDLGGGTFDVTVLEIMGGVIEIQASAGDCRIGGEDFVDVIVDHCRARVRELHGADIDSAIGRARLREAAEVAKRRLSKEEFVTLALFGLPSSAGPLDLEVPLPRPALEVAFEPLLERIRRPIERALSDAGRGAGEIDEVLLVGGATRMPCLGRLATQLFGRLPRSALPPDEAVALGAAVQAALTAGDSTVSDFISSDKAPLRLGSVSGHRLGAARVSDMTTDLESEHPRCSTNQRIDESPLNEVHAASDGDESAPTGFGDDLSGVLDMDGSALYTEKSATFTLERAHGRRSAADLVRARQRLSALRFHPREALPNVTALGRADSLYVELVGAPRMRLGVCIAEFRAALETQDNALILREREHLLVRLAELGRGPA